MKRKRVKSSCLASVGYDDAQSILEVEFVSRPRGGGRESPPRPTNMVVRYFDVPVDELWQLMRAESKGKAFNRRIRGHFEAEQAS